MVDRIRPISPPITSGAAGAERCGTPPRPATGASFQEALNAAVRFSAHAQRRLSARAIRLDADDLARLSQAVDKAQSKGGRESLILLDDLAFIVSVPDRLVVTAMDAESRKEGVFTHIDSVVLADH